MMNFKRVALAAVAAWIAYVVVGYVVNMVLLRDVYAANAHLMRADAEMNLPLGFGAGLLGFFAVAYMYAKGYEGGNGTVEGLRFGVLIGIVLNSLSVVWQYIVFPVSGELGFYWVLDAMVESIIYGTIIGTVYRPLPERTARTASV